MLTLVTANRGRGLRLDWTALKSGVVHIEELSSPPERAVTARSHIRIQKSISDTFVAIWHAETSKAYRQVEPPDEPQPPTSNCHSPIPCASRGVSLNFGVKTLRPTALSPATKGGGLRKSLGGLELQRYELIGVLVNVDEEQATTVHSKSPHTHLHTGFWSALRRKIRRWLQQWFSHRKIRRALEGAGWLLERRKLLLLFLSLRARVFVRWRETRGERAHVLSGPTNRQIR